ncbi:SIR2 family protein [Pedococcus sp. 5OH_020]|uniref:SIR2 family protein n=1 Tax=Pedococcus sp. 5OH_020 TaxID=2989814 RepID=UPI0022E9DD44|nr:SIR2 family protein [Pedococcus sp. 5OH_020]
MPEELVAAVSERRVIPFVGAGFSLTLGLPDWGQLLANLCKELDVGLSFEEINDYANSDFLQIAEYLYIKSDRRIGPLRHVIEQGMVGRDIRPATSTPHVELANLGAPQIYTTNYDDMLEKTYRALGLSFSVVALPKDVAQVNTRDTQIIKYHGDLRHEGTLVLTESAYYKRLDFESPMDLKFRSDLLGRSVLYMGYSFRDINIRLIWFKLMQMMQDIPESDRRPSYILRLGPNPVLDELYKDVGLRTIVLDPASKFNDHDRRELLGDFLGELATQSSQASPPSSRGKQFASAGFIQEIALRIGADTNPADEFLQFDLPGSNSVTMAIRRMVVKDVPQDLEDAYREALYDGMAHVTFLPPPYVIPLGRKIKQFGPHQNVTEFFLRMLRGGSEQVHSVRPILGTASLPWQTIWGAEVSEAAVRRLVREARRELAWTKAGNADDDLVYCVDLLKRVVSGQIFGPTPDSKLMAQAASIISESEQIYPAMTSYEPPADGGPLLDGALAQVQARREAIEAGEIKKDPEYEGTRGVRFAFDLEAPDDGEDESTG